MTHQEPSPAPEPKPGANGAKRSDAEVNVLLQRAAKRGGPWGRGRLFVGLFLFALLAGAIAWWLWPRSKPPELMVITFDQVAVVDQPVPLWAATEPQDGGDRRWGGHDLFFEQHTGRPPGSGTVKKASTDTNGIAQVEWHFSGGGESAAMDVRYVDEHVKPPRTSQDRGQVFLWPATARLLVVDVTPTLKDAEDRKALAAALSAAAGEGWHIVYLAARAERPLDYHKLRDWVLQQTRGLDGGLPAGPVLPRKAYYTDYSINFSNEVLADLKKTFPKQVVYVAIQEGIRFWTVEATGGLSTRQGAFPDWASVVKGLPK